MYFVLRTVIPLIFAKHKKATDFFKGVTFATTHLDLTVLFIILLTALCMNNKMSQMVIQSGRVSFYTAFIGVIILITAGIVMHHYEFKKPRSFYMTSGIGDRLIVHILQPILIPLSVSIVIALLSGLIGSKHILALIGGLLYLSSYRVDYSEPIDAIGYASTMLVLSFITVFSGWGVAVIMLMLQNISTEILHRMDPKQIKALNKPERVVAGQGKEASEKVT